MKDTFKAIEVAKDVYWVGAVELTVRDFHGYLTGRGTSYNAFLVLAGKHGVLPARSGASFLAGRFRHAPGRI